jgi:hypothetical protein
MGLPDQRIHMTLRNTCAFGVGRVSPGGRPQQQEHRMLGYMRVLAALGIGVVSLPGYSERSTAQQNPVTAIDVALEPDATMIQHAKADNARLLKAYPMGFALDPTHNPHVTLLQQFVLTADLDQVYVAANKAVSGENPTSWKLKAIKYYYTLIRRTDLRASSSSQPTTCTGCNKK